MIRVQHRDPGFTGPLTVGTVTLDFEDGVALTSERVSFPQLRRAGHTVHPVEDPDLLEYDPARYTVAQVVEHLATVAPAERDRIQATEAQGRARKGIVNFTFTPAEPASQWATEDEQNRVDRH